MKRRTFLHLGLAAALPAALAGRGFGKTRHKEIDVIVIGAGAAGLAAARKLADQEYNVLVLEGRNRLGGRIHTDLSLGFPIDLGASYIHGVNGNPLTRLAKNAGVTLRETDYDDVLIFDEFGKPVPDKLVTRVNEVFSRLLEKVPEIQAEAGTDISAQEAFWKQAGGKDISPMEQRIFAWFLRNLEDEQATDLTNHSTRHLEQDESFSDEDALLKEGYAPIVQALAKGLEIKTGTEVTRIDFRSERIKVFAGGREFSAPQVVVTLPIGVLKKGTVEFLPKLPAPKLDAIERFGVGTVNKGAIAFSKIFWPAEPDYFGFLSPHRPEKIPPDRCTACHQEPVLRGEFLFSNVLNLGGIFQKPILVGHCPGSAGIALEAQSESKNLEMMKAIYRTVWPIPDTGVEKAVFSSWHLDPFSFGSYPYLKTGTSPNLYDTLAEPVEEKLFFAGDATHRSYPSTVHGAYLSGIREAKRIISSE